MLVDGLFGPVTTDALDQTQAGSRPGPLQDSIGRIAASEGWTPALPPQISSGTGPGTELEPIFFSP